MTGDLVTVGPVTFADPYRWLREDTPETLDWQEREDTAALEELRGWPHYDRLRDQVAAVVTASPLGDIFGISAPRLLGGRWFRIAPVAAGAETTGLWVSSSAAEAGSLLVDPRLPEYARDGRPARLTWFEPSADGSRVLFGAYLDGASSGSLHVVETATGRQLPLDAPMHSYLGIPPGWLPDGSGFYVNYRTEAGCRIRLISVDAEAAAEPDVVLGDDVLPPNTSDLALQVSPSGAWVLAVTGLHEQVACQLGDRTTGEWRRFLPAEFTGECHGVWYDDDTYVAVVTDDAPRGRLVAIPVATSTDMSTWRDLLPESDAVLRCVTKLGDDLVTCEIRDCAVEFGVVTADGKRSGTVPLSEPGSSPIAVAVRRFERSEALTFTHETFTRRQTAYRYRPDEGDLVIAGEPGRELPGLVTHRRFATSRDGTRVPYFVVHRADLDPVTARPALVHAYGGFNMAWLPKFLGEYSPFLDAGGVYVHAILRGGAEYGKEWYDAGRLTNKQNTFDDLFCVAEHLIETGLSAAGMLAFHGYSNGGMLAGAAAVLRPDLWGAVVADVPLLDMLEPFTADNPVADQAMQVFAEDYGDLSDPVDVERIASWSPFHNIRDGVRYPSVLHVCGRNDAGCQPMHSRRSTAKLRAATASGRPVLLRARENYGHLPADRDQAVQHATEVLTFVMRELGLTPSGA